MSQGPWAELRRLRLARSRYSVCRLRCAGIPKNSLREAMTTAVPTSRDVSRLDSGCLNLKENLVANRIEIPVNPHTAWRQWRLAALA
eukprot:2391908-Amphidinium_carterae.1